MNMIKYVWCSIPERWIRLCWAGSLLCNRLRLSQAWADWKGQRSPPQNRQSALAAHRYKMLDKTWDIRDSMMMYDEQWINSWCDALFRNSQPKQSLFASARQNVPIEEPGQNLRTKIWEFEVWFAKSGWQNKARTLALWMLSFRRSRTFVDFAGKHVFESTLNHCTVHTSTPILPTLEISWFVTQSKTALRWNAIGPWPFSSSRDPLRIFARERYAAEPKKHRFSPSEGSFHFAEWAEAQSRKTGWQLEKASFTFETSWATCSNQISTLSASRNKNSNFCNLWHLQIHILLDWYET